ncbi:YeiH family protein [Solimicrobium silvestre]|uniref:Integral membrane protein n=1 Tax=Solimicrobium silvestre TaxID=2099400 RepID=A0A2S9H087_9BURK|nr:YeiH family protein [Solimicrobium silvestre]PRC93368.1 hypothetical protein S2091_1755 [Solimicrobium silvestre]
MLPARYKSLNPGLIPGLILCGVIAFLASFMGDIDFLQSHGFSALTIAIILGMVLGNTWYKKVEPTFMAGVGLSKHNLLRFGIILYGFRLTLQDIAGVGVAGIASDVLVLGSTFLLALFIGIKLFKLNPESVILIGAGSSICGAAAIMASDGVVEAEPEQVSVAVSTVVVFGSIAIFLYPYLYQLNLDWHWLATSANAFGIYAGSTIHEVAQVVAAGRSINPAVEDVAVITKMVRVMMLAPFLLMLSLYFARKSAANGASNVASADADTPGKPKLAIPWFAFLFIGMAVVNSLHILPAQLTHVLVQIDTILLAMAMAALGLTTHLSAVRKAGAKPLLLALILFVWLIIGGALISRLVFWL